MAVVSDKSELVSDCQVFVGLGRKLLPFGQPANAEFLLTEPKFGFSSYVRSFRVRLLGADCHGGQLEPDH